ncbi:MAG TPA: orotidine-5'-phosphate decarboxylase [Proteobacteria bacterium]|nr:orotidine 5'-phosphate decarboxylase [bacterium BMS3Abin14]HDL52395.1 orotidine-5'-phosphate decarboxylase [Pseudomonadota bacterium]
MAGGLIVALDMDGQDEACALAGEVGERVAALKVGSQLFSVGGPDIVRRIRRTGASVFLDLKFHDIPNTVRKAVEAVVPLGISFFTVHASGGRDMISAARDAARDAKVLAVTVLTSLGKSDMSEIGVGLDVEEQVVGLAKLARAAGADGIVCSPLEVALLRDTLDDECILVTPGVRPVGSAGDDQTRIATPAQAVRAGADYLVVGRPVVKAPDRVRAVEMILDEMGVDRA